ncbi:unnamed protein product [Brachionus calyciflorus]|uniref:Reverse transcriptase domain-containing protein n=1 Tax=Brachionus calyciflorus TaxID=104777 RepID=A0A813MCD8_9BILA|nr:unnamed protein product [Brachionus calyciflorus]
MIIYPFQSVSLSYADDLKLCGKVKSKLEGSHELQKDLDVLYEWSRVWSTELNLSKCKAMYICGKCLQRRATKLVKSIKDKPYDWRLNFLNLQNLEERRVRGDLIQMYKLINGLEKVKLVNGINYAQLIYIYFLIPTEKEGKHFSYHNHQLYNKLKERDIYGITIWRCRKYYSKSKYHEDVKDAKVTMLVGRNSEKENIRASKGPVHFTPIVPISKFYYIDAPTANHFIK